MFGPFPQDVPGALMFPTCCFFFASPLRIGLPRQANFSRTWLTCSNCQMQTSAREGSCLPGPSSCNSPATSIPCLSTTAPSCSDSCRSSTASVVRQHVRLFSASTSNRGANSVVFQQRSDRGDHLRRFLPTAFRPAPFRRTPSC